MQKNIGDLLKQWMHLLRSKNILHKQNRACDRSKSYPKLADPGARVLNQDKTSFPVIFYMVFKRALSQVPLALRQNVKQEGLHRLQK